MDKESIKNMQLSQLDEIYSGCDVDTLILAIIKANNWLVGKAHGEGFQDGFDKGYECKEREVARNA